MDVGQNGKDHVIAEGKNQDSIRATSISLNPVITKYRRICKRRHWIGRTTKSQHLRLRKGFTPFNFFKYAIVILTAMTVSIILPIRTI